MAGKDIRFIGFLANVQGSLHRLKPSHGFEIHRYTYQRLGRLLAGVERMTGIDVSELCDRSTLIPGERTYCYCVTSVLPHKAQSTKHGGVVIPVPPIRKHSVDYVEKYLMGRVAIMRLFREGDVSIPCWCYYCGNDNHPNIMSVHHGRYWPRRGLKYEVRGKETSQLQQLLDTIDLPFAAEYLRLSLRSFELSYVVPDMGLKFLSLMMALETLLIPSPHELRYRVSRNAAVLLGDNREDANRIFRELKTLYNKRSKLVHEGRGSIISHHDIRSLGNYVRRAILEVCRMSLNKQELGELLNSCGFGESPWRSANR